MKNWMKSMLIVFCGMMIVTSFTACGGDSDDDENGGGNGNTSSGITGWYIRKDLANEINNPYSVSTTSYKFNMQGEIIAIVNWPWETVPSEENVSGFTWHGNDAVYYIPDDETFIKYYGSHYRENAPAAAGKTLLYKFNYSNLGTVGLYAEDTYYYTYWRDGNKLYTTEDGWTVYTITSSGLIPDGSSFVYSKYDPNTTY